MNKIQEIVQAWATAINPSDEQRDVAEQRLQTCMSCEFWSNSLVATCTKCGCATKAKVFSPRGIQACPEGKWTV